MESPTQPYAPPASNVQLDERLEMNLAGNWRRFFTLLIDYAGFMVFAALLGVVLGFVLGDGVATALANVPDFLLGAGVFFVYYLVFEGLGARTPGKWLLGTIVVDESGRKPTLGQIAGRTLARLIPFEPFSFLFGERGWHDRFSGTRVVRVPRR